VEFDDAVAYPAYVAAVPPPQTDGPQCVICEFVMERLEKDLADKKTQEEIKNTVLSVCSRMPKSINEKCKSFIYQYANLVIAFIDTMPPKEICAQLDLCDKKKLAGKSKASIE
jgi:saposin